MYIKKIFSLIVFALCLTGFLYQPVLAGMHLPSGDNPDDPAGYPEFDPQWKEKQDAMFEKHGLKDGDVYDSTNCEKIKDLLPPSVYNWVKKGEWTIPIMAQTYDFGTSWAKMQKYSDLNRGKYDIGPNQNLIEKASGSYPKDMTGLMFPVDDIDFSDPQGAAIRLMHNSFTYTRGSGGLVRDLLQEWIGDEGPQRSIHGTLNILSYLDSNNHIPNPNEFKSATLLVFDEPHDIKGTAALTWRYLDGSADKGFTYIPVIRRVKRSNAASRSTSSMGTDFCRDDQNCYWGTVEVMDWKLIKEVDFLVPSQKGNLAKIQQNTELPDGSWDADQNVEPLLVGYDNPDWKGAPWAFQNVVWTPKAGWLIEFFPKDDYYTYGRQEVYIPKRQGTPTFKIVYNRAGEYWKTITAIYNCYRRGTSIGASTDSYLAVDDKTHHATVAVSSGKFKGYTFRGLSRVPWLEPGMFTPNYLTRLSR
jgi:hypothetical protein